LTEAVREGREKSAAEFEVQLSAYLSELLSSFNDRDTALVRERLDVAKNALQDELDASLDQLYGGSVAKHTYIDGLSDIDSLLIINGSKFEDNRPATILSGMEAILLEQLGDVAKVEHGRMAVTLTYKDGMCIQLLPAIRTEEGLKVPSCRHEGWSHIDPTAFRSELTKRNDQCGGKLIPTIKLAKAVIATLPEQHRLSGYHVESLAIAAFRGYDGVKTTAAMLPHFFERAKTLIGSPIKDKTGQSVHVDEYLGPENSEVRQYLARLLGNLAKRMTNASASQSKAQWEALFFSE